MEPTFKKGDRVRLKAWAVSSGPHYKYFNHNSVGIVGQQAAMTRIMIFGKDHTVVITALPKKYTRRHKYTHAAVPTEDLELMPEQQVHVVKDGKVYELRKGEGDVVGVGDCLHCAFRATNCSKVHNLDACTKGWYNFQEVTSGKLVS